MQLTPAIKGQLTKAVKQWKSSPAQYGDVAFSNIRHIFQKAMPPEQAKHAARKYLTTLHA